MSSVLSSSPVILRALLMTDPMLAPALVGVEVVTDLIGAAATGAGAGVGAGVGAAAVEKAGLAASASGGCDTGAVASGCGAGGDAAFSGSAFAPWAPWALMTGLTSAGLTSALLRSGAFSPDLASFDLSPRLN